MGAIATQGGEAAVKCGDVLCGPSQRLTPAWSHAPQTRVSSVRGVDTDGRRAASSIDQEMQCRRTVGETPPSTRLPALARLTPAPRRQCVNRRTFAHTAIMGQANCAASGSAAARHVARTLHRRFAALGWRSRHVPDRGLLAVEIGGGDSSRRPRACSWAIASIIASSTNGPTRPSSDSPRTAGPRPVQPPEAEQFGGVAADIGSVRRSSQAEPRKAAGRSGPRC